MSATTLTYSNTTYEVIKHIVQIVLPASATLYITLGSLWNLPRTEEVSGTITALALFLGVTLLVSNKNYHKEADGVINVQDKTNGGTLFDLVLNQEPEDLKDRSKVVFAVNKNE